MVLSFMSCGHCARCTAGQPAYCAKGHPLCFGGAREDGSTAMRDGHGAPVHDHFFGQSSFGTYALVNERTVVKVSKDMPLERLGPLGCGIQTGAGSVMNALKVGPGDSFVAFGAGSVGLSACGIVGAAPIGTTASFDMGGLMSPGKKHPRNLFKATACRNCLSPSSSNCTVRAGFPSTV